MRLQVREDGRTGAPERLLETSRPLVLDSSGGIAAWRILSGTVEVFAVSTDGARANARSFVRIAETGGWLLTAPALFCALTAFAAEEAILSPVRTDRDDLPMEVVDSWLTDLAQAVSRERSDAGSGPRAVASGEALSLEAGEAIASGGGLVWIVCDRGDVSLFGEAGGPGAGAQPVPLSGTTWTLAGADGADVRVLGTAEVLRRHDCADLLSRAQALLLAAIERGRAAREAAEALRVDRSVATSVAEFRRTVETFARPERIQARPSASFARDPLAAACRMVATALGADIPEHRESSDAPGDLHERIARLTRLPVREITLYGRWWRQELGPMVGFRRDGGEPVALLPVGRRGYALHDPATGSADPVDERVASALTPSAFALYPGLPERDLSGRDLLRFGVDAAPREAALMIGLAGIGAALALVMPVAIGFAVDTLIPSHLRSQVVVLGLMLLLVTAVQLVVRLASDFAQLRLAGIGGARLEAAVVDRFLRLPSDTLDRFTSADLAQRALVIDQVRRNLGIIVVDGLLSGIFALANLLLLVIYDPAAALVGLVLLALFIGATVWAAIRQLPALEQSEIKTAQASQLAFQFIDNIGHLRAAAAEERAFARWGAAFADTQDALLRAGRVSANFAAFASGYELLGLAAFFVALAWLRSPGTTTGALVVAVVAFSSFTTTSAAFGIALQHAVLILPKLRRATRLLRVPPEVDRTKIDPGALSGRIEVSHVTFGYAPGAPPALDDVSLSIAPGEFVAFVGPSGCGKSTLLKLLLGFERAQLGSISLDGQDLTRLDLQAVRRQIGVVLQNGRLMPGSIGENILGVTGGSNESAWEAARLAGLSEDIEAMPMGMHTVLTDGASTLSGGQMQRLLIARALAGRPRMLFFDEATSALDNRTQAIVTASLDRMAITRIVIAHRLSTVERADRIFVFSRGRVVQTGRFEELRSVPGPFSDFAQRQLI